MKIIKVLGITIGATVFLFVFLFCCYGHIFHFPLPSRVHYKAEYDLLKSDKRIVNLFKHSNFGTHMSTSTAGFDGRIVRIDFYNCSVYDEKFGRIYYQFRNYGEEPIWIKSKTLQRLTGKLWKIYPGEDLYFIFSGPPALEIETARLDLLYEEKILGITFRFGALGTAMNLLVSHEHKF